MEINKLGALEQYTQEGILAAPSAGRMMLDHKADFP